MMKRKKIPPAIPYLPLLAILWVFVTPARAQESFAFDLDQCIEYALKNNLNIQNARFDEYIAQARVKEILANGYPQIDIRADLQFFPELPTSIIPASFSPSGEPFEAQFGLPWQSTAGANVNQLMFDGTFFLGLKAAKTFVEVTNKGIARSSEETAIAVARAYYQALITQEQLNLIETNIQRLVKLFEETSALNAEGFVEKIDVDRLEINLNNLQLEKEKIQRLSFVGINLLKFQMGMEISNELTLTENMQKLKDKPVFDMEEKGFDPNLRIEYQELKGFRSLEAFNLKSVQIGYYPSLYAFGSYQFNAQRDRFDFFDSNQRWFPISVVGLQLNIPVFDGLRKNAQAQQIRLNLKKIDNQIGMMEESFHLELSNSLANLKNAYTSLQAYEKNVNLAQKIFDVANIKYKEGVGSSLELNEAESQLKQAESAYLSGFLEFLLYQADYKKARGEFSKYQQN